MMIMNNKRRIHLYLSSVGEKLYSLLHYLFTLPQGKILYTAGVTTQKKKL